MSGHWHDDEYDPWCVCDVDDDWHGGVYHPVWTEGCADCVTRAERIEEAQR